MPNSVAKSIPGTVSTSRASHTGGVKLTPSGSEASTTSAGGAVIYTPSTASEAFRTPTASIASALPTTSVSLNAVFARLKIEDQRNAVRQLQKRTLSQALGCTLSEVADLLASASSDELWAAFCQLSIENRKKALENVRKGILRKAFEEQSDEEHRSSAKFSHIASVAPSKATTATLASAFKKLSVEDEVKQLAAIKSDNISKKVLRRGANGWGLDDIGEIEDKNETLLDNRPDLAEWQELCRACGVDAEDIPGSITKCKEILKTKNVALSDLSEAIEQGTVAQTFPSLTQLRKYVLSQNKMANKATTKENRLLKKMLRELFRYRTTRAGGSE